MENPGTNTTETVGTVKALANSDQKSAGYPVQVFETEPTDTDLAKFADHTGKTSSFRVTETPESITAKPATLPRWLVVLSLMMLFALVIWAPRTDETQPETEREYTIRIVGSVILAGFFVVSVYFINRTQRSKGNYFIFDKIEHTLSLPIYNVKLMPNQIHSFFQLYAKCRGLSTWACELSVLVKVEGTRLCRYSVVIDPSRRRVERIAKQLSELLSVPLRTLKLDRKTRKAFRTGSNVNT